MHCHWGIIDGGKKGPGRSFSPPSSQFKYIMSKKKLSTAQQLSLLNQTTLDSFDVPNIGNIVKSFALAGLKITKGDYGMAWYRTDDEEKYRLAFESRNLPFSPLPPRSKGFRSKVENKKSPHFESKIKKSSGFQESILRFIKSFVIIPVSYKNHVYGNMVLYFKKTHYFSANEKSLCTVLGHTAAQAITIHNLNQRVRRAKKHLEERVRHRTMELEESREKLRQERVKDEAILASIGEGIIAIDRDGKIIIMNPTAELILGQDSRKLMGMPFLESLRLYDHHKKLLPAGQRPTYQTLKTGQSAETPKNKNFYYAKGDNGLVPVSITVNPIILKGEIVGAIEVFRDITKEQEIDRVKSELISLASHQLRTPLSAINWYTEALSKGELGAMNTEQKKYLKEIYTANQRMIELVYDFLNVSRMELGTFNLKLEDLNIKDMAEQAVKELRPLIKGRRLSVTQHYGSNLNHVQMDRKIISLILQNLLSNAVKYSKPKGKIKINVGLNQLNGKNKTLSITIKDNGFGIPEQQQAKIFSKLFRADNAAQLDAGGTGLGLYLAKSFVEFCKGKIWFKSALNQGTTFWVELPVAESELVKVA